MKYSCPHCGQHLESGDSFAGERIECPACGQTLVTPEERDAPKSSRGGPGPWPTPKDATAGGDGARVCPTLPADAADASPVDEDGHTIIETSVSRQSGIDRSTMTISQYMAEHGLEGQGVNLSSTGSSAADILTAENGRKYDMGQIVAEGGMGAIIDARDRNLKRSVAMKVLHNPGQTSRNQLLRFIEEAQVTAQLQHPGIVPTHELGVDASGNPFYTMKMIKGDTLRAILEKIRDGNTKTIEQYPLPRLLTVFQRVCDAIAFAHSKRVIHRDLKPENIMVGQYGETLVMDWGLAKILPKKDWRKKGGKPGGGLPGVKPKTIVESVRSGKVTNGNGMHTMDGTIMGTPQFMAPEQAQGEIEQIDERTDVYALGAILYNILTLHPPISGKDVDEMLANVTSGNIPHPSTYQKNSRRKPIGKPTTATEAPALAHCPGCHIPEALSAIALKALALEPRERYARVVELQRDIEAYQTGFAVSAQQASAWRQMCLLIGRHKGLFTGIGIALGALAVVTAAYVMRIRQSEQRALGNLELARENYELAQARFAALKATVPVFMNQSRLQMESNDFEAALTTLDPAMALDPDNVALWRQRGDILQNLLRLDEAAEAYRRALALEPSDRLTQDNLAICERLLRMPATDGQAPPQWIRALADHFFLYGRLREAGAMQGRMSVDREQLRDQWEPLIRRSGIQGSLTQDEAGAFVYTMHGNRDFYDLTPFRQLRGMPLASVDLTRTAITDLSPLEGFALQSLRLQSTKVRDLSPLQGMPLQELNVQNTQVADLSPLQGMQLQVLNIQDTQVADLSPLQGMPLQELDIQGTQVADLSPLQGMPLQELRLQFIRISDLSPLQGMQLQVLWINGTRVSDLSPLQGMPLQELQIDGTRVSDLSPLQGMPLQALDIRNTQVADLSPLKDMPLENIFLTNTQVADLSPLKGMRLTSITLRNTNIQDLTPLNGMSLKYIAFSPQNITTGMNILLETTTLERVNIYDHGTSYHDQSAFSIPIAEFRERYDAGEFQPND